MRIRIVLITLLCAFNGHIKAQISKIDFDKAVDILNCKSIELSLKKSSTSGVTAHFKSQCNCQNSPDFTTIISAIPQSEDKTIALSDEFNQIKNFEFNAMLQSGDVINLLTESIFDNQTKYKKIYDFAVSKKNDPLFEQLKKDLKKELLNVIPPQSQASPNVTSQLDTVNSPSINQPQTLEQRILKLEQFKASIDDQNWFIKNINYFVIISFLLSFIAIIHLISTAIRSTLRQNPEESDIIRMINDRRITDFIQTEINKSLDKSRITDSVINKLKINNPALFEQQSNKKPDAEWIYPQQPTSPLTEYEQPEIKKPDEIFFLSTPNLDGSFNESSSSITYKEGASIYKFVKVGKNIASFQIDEREASVKLALQYPDKSIDPVCEAVNAFNPKAKRITTVDVGKAELENGKWIKTTKAKIRYES